MSKPVLSYAQHLTLQLTQLGYTADGLPWLQDAILNFTLGLTQGALLCAHSSAKLSACIHAVHKFAC